MKSKLQQKQLVLLEETIAFYNSNNRCIDDEGNCKYFMEGKAGCAIGRLIEDKDLCKKLDRGIKDGDIGPLYSVSSPEIFRLLPDNVKYYEQDFLKQLQLLHDWSSNWNEAGLSDGGLDQVKHIKTIFQL